MPIFHDPFDSPPRRSSYRQTSFSGQPKLESPEFARNTSELASLRPSEGAHHGVQPSMDSDLHASGRKQPKIDRVNLIEHLKRTKSPSWQHDQHVSQREPRETIVHPSHPHRVIVANPKP
jgi:hypothetical protein